MDQLDPSVKMISVEIDGRTVEVALPAGYLAETEVRERFVPKQTFQTEITRRLKGKVTREELMQDEAFVAEVLAAHAAAPGTPAPTDAAKAEALRAQYRREFENKDLKPVTEKLTKYEAAFTKIQARERRSEILAAASQLMADEFTTAPEGATPLAVSMFETQLKYDDETGQHWAVGADGEFLPSVTGKGPYKSAKELITDFVATNKTLGKAQIQAGPGVKPARGAAAKPTITTQGGFWGNLDKAATGEAKVALS